MVANRLYLHPGTENEFSVLGYRLNYLKTTLYSILCVFTLGFAILPLYWKPNWLIYLLFTKVESVNCASDVLVKDFHQRYFRRRLFKLQISSDQTWNLLRQRLKHETERQVSTENDSHNIDVDKVDFKLDETGRELLCFSYQKSNYIISDDGSMAAKFPSFSAGLTLGDATQNIKRGLPDFEVESRRGVYGSNQIDINPKSIPKLLVQEILHPFYFFQLFSVTVWIIDDYLYYSLCIIFLSVMSIFWSLYMTYSQQRKVIKMTKGDFVISVLRNGREENIWQQELVPGDLVVIPQNGCSMTFDAVLLTGTCIVNESMLTGESVPVTKTPFAGGNSLLYSEKYHAKHTLYSGTAVLQSRAYSNDKCYAVVANTGFYTMKGELIRSILYPKPMSFRLFFDAILFTVFLMGVAMIGFVYTLVLMINRQEPIKEIILKPLDIITIAVPPALPAALNIGMVFAQRRLRNRKIFCVSPQRIDVAGSVDVVCFDKTGTLTEDDMTFKHVVTVDKSSNVMNNEEFDVRALKPDSKLVVGISTCHSLTKIEGELVGDPMDLKLFNASGWSYSEQSTGTGFDFDSLAPSIVTSPNLPNGQTIDIGLVRQFPFSSEMQRMAVVVRDSREDHYEFFLKGAPEKVASLCAKLPSNFSQSLDFYARNGFRVLALAYKPLDAKMAWHKIHKATLNDLEQNLEFLGFLVFYNKLKEASSPVIHKLHAANIRSIMVTGDNIATATAVARDCILVRKHTKLQTFYYRDDVLNFSAKNYQTSESVFAMTGDAFSALKDIKEEAVAAMFLKRSAVFARMSPEQKSELVEKLQDLGYYVGMVGDGANDCGALKIAHVGISLSELEASAASPFTSAVPDVSCVDRLIREGRASLVNSFATFKFMGLYSMIQFTSIVLLYWFDTTLGDLQFLWMDMGIITGLMLTMGATEASDKLSKYRPPVRLFNGVIFLSLIAAIVAQFAAQCLSLAILKSYSWYIPLDTEAAVMEESIVSQENTAINYISMLLYIVCAVGFSPGPPHRKHLFTNIPYVICILLLLVVQGFMMFYPENWSWIRKPMDFVYIESISFKIVIIILSLICLFLLIFLEFYLLATKDKLTLPKWVKSETNGSPGNSNASSPKSAKGSKYDVSSAYHSQKSLSKYSNSSLPDYAKLEDGMFSFDNGSGRSIQVISSL